MHDDHSGYRAGDSIGYTDQQGNTHEAKFIRYVDAAYCYVAVDGAEQLASIADITRSA